MSSRWVNVVMSMVLVCAGLLGQGAERANNLVLGFAVFLVSFAAMASPGARRLNTALGAWAMVSPFVLAYRDEVPGWLDVLVGLVVLVASLWPNRPTRRLRPAGARAV